MFIAACGNDEKINLSEYQGKWIVINYWALWCKPCHEEIPELNAFHHAHKNKDAVVLGVNFDPTGDTDDAIKIMKIEYPVLKEDPAASFGIKTIDALPFTLLIDKEGKLKKRLYGPQTKEGLEELIHHE